MTAIRRTGWSSLWAAGLLVVILVVTAFLGGLWLGSRGQTGAAGATGTTGTTGACIASATFRPVCDAYERISSDYVDKVQDAELVHGAVKGMVEALPDPYSGYLPPGLYESARDNLSGEFSGIGAEVGIENVENSGDSDDCTVITADCSLVIVAPLDGSPAKEAGLRSGDVIVQVNGDTTLGLTAQQAVLEVRGKEGTKVTLTIRRDGEQQEVTITRGVIDVDLVQTRLLDNNIGYIRLASFGDDAVDEFHAGLASLLDQGATSIVFDLRDNPGGYINAARQIAGEFLRKGALVFTQESGGNVVEWRVEDPGLLSDGETNVALLVNEGSASASEIVAAALKEHDRATLVGEATFGKNTVQSWSELPDGGGLKLTTDRWFTPEHHSVAPDGVQPDVVVDAPDETPLSGGNSDDPILERAVQSLLQR